MNNELDVAALLHLSNPDCEKCRGLGTVRHYIGHEGRGAIFPCDCAKRQPSNNQPQR